MAKLFNILFVVIVVVIGLLIGAIIMSLAGCKDKEEPISTNTVIFDDDPAFLEGENVTFEENSYQSILRRLRALEEQAEYWNVSYPDIINVDVYDPNDAIYKFIPAADESWTEQFGDNERTRLIHSISEIRVVLSNQGQVLQALLNQLNDPNMIIEDVNDG